jgi:hypothetical protein
VTVPLAETLAEAELVSETLRDLLSVGDRVDESVSPDMDMESETLSVSVTGALNVKGAVAVWVGSSDFVAVLLNETDVDGDVVEDAVGVKVGDSVRDAERLSVCVYVGVSVNVFVSVRVADGVAGKLAESVRGADTVGGSLYVMDVRVMLDVNEEVPDSEVDLVRDTVAVGGGVRVFDSDAVPDREVVTLHEAETVNDSDADSDMLTVGLHWLTLRERVRGCVLVGAGVAVNSCVNEADWDAVTVGGGVRVTVTVGRSDRDSVGWRVWLFVSRRLRVSVA